MTASELPPLRLEGTTKWRGNMGWLLLWIGFAVVTAIAASSRGRSGGVWFFLGLVFGVFGLIAVLVMPRVEAYTPAPRMALPNRSEERRVGKECVSTGRSRWSRDHSKKKKNTT